MCWVLHCQTVLIFSYVFPSVHQADPSAGICQHRMLLGSSCNITCCYSDTSTHLIVTSELPNLFLWPKEVAVCSRHHGLHKICRSRDEVNVHIPNLHAGNCFRVMCVCVWDGRQARLYVVGNGQGSPCLDLRRVPDSLADATIGTDLVRHLAFQC